jgi:hypothetical protein
MTWRQPGTGYLAADPALLAYLIASRDDTVLAEVIADRHARRIEPHLVLTELTDAEADVLRRQYAGRAVVTPDAPMSPFCS